MSDREQERKERYDRARTGFDDLETDEKVIFLMEAAVSTVARGIDAFGRAVSEEIDHAFRKRGEKKAETKTNGEAAESGAGASPDESDEAASDTNGEETS